MDAITALAASGMRSRMESLDIIANNLANAGAPGFKADREFHSLYLSEEASASARGSDPMVEPVTERHWTDFAQGSLSTTDNPLNVAIGGKGFFSVDSPSGILFTRDGSFRMSAQGVLQTQEAYPIRGKDGKPIQVDPGKTLEIAPDGSIRQDGLDVAQLDVVDFADVHALSKHGQNYFQLSSNDLKPIAASNAEILQGKLESANFQPAESAVRLITVMRQFESLQKAISLGMDMNRKTIEDVARVG